MGFQVKNKTLINVNWLGIYKTFPIYVYTCFKNNYKHLNTV